MPMISLQQNGFFFLLFSFELFSFHVCLTLSLIKKIFLSVKLRTFDQKKKERRRKVKTNKQTIKHEQKQTNSQFAAGRLSPGVQKGNCAQLMF